MIPKIIHYCWLSNDPFPESIQKCIDSWKKYLPDYELMLWNFKRFPRGKSKWVDQAFDSHKYAFAADYIRLYALYHYGGIYLDSDVEVLKSFNNLLDLPYFIGQEKTPSGIEAATIGCEKGNNLIKDILESYKDRDFINSNGSYSILPLPFIFRKCIEARYNYKKIDKKEKFDYSRDVINVFPVDWFSPKHWKTKEIEITDNTYSIHHFTGSWLQSNTKEEENAKQETAERETTKKGQSLQPSLRFLITSHCRRLALSNRWFAKVYFNIFKKDLFQPNPMLIIYKPDYWGIPRMSKSYIDSEIEFINKEESNHKDKVIDFYPIMRIKGTDIEIHPYYCDQNNVITKDYCLKLLREI